MAFVPNNPEGSGCTNFKQGTRAYRVTDAFIELHELGPVCVPSLEVNAEYVDFQGGLELSDTTADSDHFRALCKSKIFQFSH